MTWTSFFMQYLLKQSFFIYELWNCFMSEIYTNILNYLYFWGNKTYKLSFVGFVIKLLFCRKLKHKSEDSYIIWYYLATEEEWSFVTMKSHHWPLKYEKTISHLDISGKVNQLNTFLSSLLLIPKSSTEGIVIQQRLLKSFIF